MAKTATTSRARSSLKIANPIQIVVLDRGYVYVGRVRRDSNFVHITNARNVRRWGTSKGLGELVRGPLSPTVLDPAGTVHAPLRALIALIDVEQEPWAKICI
ncbi:MAG: hypothetical protein ACYDCJ_12410 [Gammaproteobacteria bacterium]